MNGDTATVERKMAVVAESFNVTLPTLQNMEMLGDRILIKRIEDPTAGKSKIILPQGQVDKSPWAVCIMAGPGALVKSPGAEGRSHTETTQRIGAGDLLLIKSFGGTEFKLGVHDLIIIQPEHVLALFQKGPKSNVQ